MAISPAAELYSQSPEELRQAEARINRIRQCKIELIQENFNTTGLSYPPKCIFILIFKLEGLVELWATDDDNSKFKLFTVYPITASSGTLGPKRKQGDLQIPEGFYHIDRFNPWSSFHLSLGINYPNKSDRILKTGADPGGDIFIHGSSVTIGCIPIGNSAIEELYITALDVKTGGQRKIPVHIFPCRIDEQANVDTLRKLSQGKPKLAEFWQNLREGYDIFQHSKKLPEFRINDDGKYMFSNDQSDARIIRVSVALCDNEHQGIVPVSAELGDGMNPNTNLYWGAMYGVRAFFDRDLTWKRMVKVDSISDMVLERIIYKYWHNDADNHPIFIIADAYRGDHIREAIIDFFRATANSLPADSVQFDDSYYLNIGKPDLVVYIGHDGLMDFDILPITAINAERLSAPQTMILACFSKDYFGSYLTRTSRNQTGLL